MDMFPEIFSGEAGISGVSFATGFADQTPGGGNFAVVELFNPSLTNVQAVNNTSEDILVTVTGLIIFGAAAGDFQILKSATATDVAGGATAGPQFMDQRVTAATRATFKMGTPNAIPGSIIAALPVGIMIAPVVIPFNWDLPQGTGLNFAFSVAATRAAITVVWIERVRTE